MNYDFASDCCVCAISFCRWDDCQCLMPSAGACGVKGLVCNLGLVVVLRIVDIRTICIWTQCTKSLRVAIE